VACAPVVLFVYNRLNHTRQTVDALSRNLLAAESDLWIFSDGAKSKEVEPQVAVVREYVASLAEQSVFRSVIVVESKNNKGLASSIIDGVTTVMATADRAIVLEDDLVTSADFLSFMNDCLLYYQDKSVGAISGYSPLRELPVGYSESVYVSKRNCSHGWATWRDRWQMVDWSASGFNQLRKSARLRREFDSTGADRFDRLRRQIENDINSWSIRFGFHLFMQELVVVYPSVNRVSNIGFDGSGVHAEGAHLKKIHRVINSRPVSYWLSFPMLDVRISRLFYEIYSGGWIRVLVRRLRNSEIAFALRSAKRMLMRN
jgi:hypothetical protein